MWTAPESVLHCVYNCVNFQYISLFCPVYSRIFSCRKMPKPFGNQYQEPQHNIITYRWHILQFSSLPSMKPSPIIRSYRDANCFYLRILSKEQIQHLSHFVAIYLLRCEPLEGDITVWYRISILDKMKHKRLSKEFSAIFLSNNTRQLHGGVYLIDQEYLLNEANGFVQNDSLNVYCEIHVQTGQITKTQMSFDSQILKMTADFNSLLQSGQHSDVLFVVGKEQDKESEESIQEGEPKKEFKLHKNILSTRSPVFCAMFSNDFVEKRENRVEITDMSVRAFEELIRYIYTGKCEGPEFEKNTEELYEAADKYQLELLKDLTSKELSTQLTIETVSRILNLSDMNKDHDLYRHCTDYISENCDKVIHSDTWRKLIEPNHKLVVKLYRNLAEKRSK